MTMLAPSGRVEMRRSRQELSARRAFGLLARLYARRLANRVELGVRQDASRRAAPAKGPRWALWRNASLLALGLLTFCFRAYTYVAELAQEHGPKGALGVSVLLSSGAIGGLLLTGLFSPRPASNAEAEAAWLSMLPVPAWVPFACKLCERGLLNPYGWLLFPLFTGLAAYGGWSWLAPLASLSLCAPVVLLAGLVSGVGEVLVERFSNYRWFRVVSRLAPAAAALPLLGVLLVGVLEVFELPRFVGVASREAGISRGLGFVGELRWLPFAEPARFLLARGAPAEALGWLGAFCAEVGAAIALCVWALRRNYGAEVWGRGRSVGVRRAREPFAGRAPRAWDRWPSVAVLRNEWLGAKRDRSWVARFASLVVLGNGAVILLGAKAPTSLARPAPVLIGLGASLVLGFRASLERSRPGLRWSLSLPRPISWTVSRQAAIAGAVAVLCASPAALVTWARLPVAKAGVEQLLFGALSVVALAYLQAALWMRHAHPDSVASPLRAALNRGQVLVVAAALVSATVLPNGESWKYIPLALVFLVGSWRRSVASLERSLDPSSSPEPLLDLQHGAVVMLALAAAQSFFVGFAAAGNLGHPTPHKQFLAAQLGLVLTGLGAIMWAQPPRFPRGNETLWLTRGNGLGVLLREGIAWGAIATFGALLWIRLFPPPESTMGFILADHPWLLVGLFCFVVPFFEELLFRGFVYRTLRKGWGWLPSALLSAAVFAANHPAVYLAPIFFLGVCAAAAFERARSIAAPMLMHALYNGVIIAIELAK